MAQFAADIDAWKPTVHPQTHTQIQIWKRLALYRRIAAQKTLRPQVSQGGCCQRSRSQTLLGRLRWIVPTTYDDEVGCSVALSICKFCCPVCGPSKMSPLSKRIACQLVRHLQLDARKSLQFSWGKLQTFWEINKLEKLLDKFFEECHFGEAGGG